MDSAYAIVWFRGFTEDPHFDGVMWERNWDTTALKGIGDQDSMAWRSEVEQSVTVNAWILANLCIQWMFFAALKTPLMLVLGILE